MTAEEFRKTGILLFGPKRGWQSRLADALQVDKSTVTRYLSTGPNGPVSLLMLNWLEKYHEKEKSL